MSFRVRIADTHISFVCDAGQSILAGAERAGLVMPYSCRKGVCGTCEGRLVRGEVQVRGRRIAGAADAVMMCQTRPCADVAIGVQRIERRAEQARKTLTASVYRLARPTANVGILTLRFPIGVRATFRSGQHLQVVMADGDRRNFSMANPSYANDGAELHIGRVPGRFSETTLASLAVGDRLTVELPFGQFYLRPAHLPAILLASGTGFAPMKAMIEDALRRGQHRPMRLYWGARDRDDLYMLERVQRWQQAAGWFSFVPVLARPRGDWHGRTGLAHHAVLEDYADLSGVEVYACGNPRMVAAARRDFAGKARLVEARFYSDAFVASGPAPASSPSG